MRSGAAGNVRNEWQRRLTEPIGSMNESEVVPHHAHQRQETR